MLELKNVFHSGIYITQYLHYTDLTPKYFASIGLQNIYTSSVDQYILFTI